MTTPGLAASAAGALAQSSKLEVIASNLANGSTPAYRREFAAFRSELDRVVAADREQGNIETTNRALDFAIDGPGYFTVADLETGTAYYTRAGNFTIDSTGRLVTADGRCQVLASDGRGIALDPAAAGSLRLREDGTILQGEVEYGQLVGVQFEDVARLARRGDNLYENRGATLGDAPAGRIRQGTLERSTVNPVLEMAEMIKALRALEANLQMIRIQDATLERTVNEFGRPAK